MRRTSRASQGGFVNHVLNRGNGRSDVFHKDDDFAAFVKLMREAHEKVPRWQTVGPSTLALTWPGLVTMKCSVLWENSDDDGSCSERGGWHSG
jgi:hypothetical protein